MADYANKTDRNAVNRIALSLFICLQDRKDGIKCNSHLSSNKGFYTEIYMARAHSICVYVRNITISPHCIVAMG